LKTKTVADSEKEAVWKKTKKQKESTNDDVLYKIEDRRVTDDPEGYFINLRLNGIDEI
jgi:hypothetical protein